MVRRARKSRGRKFSDQLRGARDASGLKQEQLAMRAGISVGHYSKLERGVHAPSLEHLRAIAVALGITLDLLVNGDHVRQGSDAPGAL